jgi:hypothetical protein
MSGAIAHTGPRLRHVPVGFVSLQTLSLIGQEHIQPGSQSVSLVHVAFGEPVSGVEASTGLAHAPRWAMGSLAASTIPDGTPVVTPLQVHASWVLSHSRQPKKRAGKHWD